MPSKTDYIVRSLSRGTNKKYETYIINAIWNKLNDSNFEFSTQQYVKDNDGNTRYIDMYFPQVKVAVEIDECYHNNQCQLEKDNKRTEAIKTAILDSVIADKVSEITFKRIQIFNQLGENKNTDELNSDIEELITLIKSKASELEITPKWDYDEDKRTNAIISRGYLMRGDYFSTMKNIMYIFGKKVKGWRKSAYYIKEKEMMIWSPTLSLDGSNRDEWINTINDDLSIICESGTGVKGKEKKESDALWDTEHKTKRIVFLKYKDALGKRYRKFLGVYMCGGYDTTKKAEIWKMWSDRCNLKGEV